MLKEIIKEIKEYKDIFLKAINPFLRWAKRLINIVLDVHAIEMQGILSAKLIKKNGSIEDLGVIARKKVTDEFAAYMVDQMQAESSDFGDFKYHKSGTGVGAENKTDTALGTSVEGTARDVGTQTEGASAWIYRSVVTISYTGAHAITEHGIFNEAYVDAEDNGILLDRSVFDAINVINGDSIQFTYELTVTAEA